MRSLSTSIFSIIESGKKVKFNMFCRDKQCTIPLDTGNMINIYNRNQFPVYSCKSIAVIPLRFCNLTRLKKIKNMK